MTGGIPIAETYERIIGLVNADELNKILLDFFEAITLKKEPKVKLNNFDGRVNNGSKRNVTLMNEAVTPLNCLNVYDNYLQYCIATKKISEKSNEIPAIEDLVKGMNLTGIIATWDALNTQKDNVAAVLDAGGDYTVPIKGNQPDFHQNLIDYFDEDRCDEIIAGNTQSQYLTYIEKSHSSIIKYECFQTSDIDWYDRKDEWKGLQTIGLVRKTITKKELVKNERKNAKNKDKKVAKEVTSVENRYFISSRLVNIEEFNIATRGQWNVENKIHFHLDFTFRQDANSTTNKNALLNLEIIHKFALAVLSKVQTKYNGKSLKSIRKHLSNNIEEFLPELLCYLLLY